MSETEFARCLAVRQELGSDEEFAKWVLADLTHYLSRRPYEDHDIRLLVGAMRAARDHDQFCPKCKKPLIASAAGCVCWIEDGTAP